MVTQGFLCISPGVALDKIPSTRKKKFRIRCLTSSISIEFDADKAPEESKLIWFFWEGLKPWLGRKYASGN